MVGCEGIAAAVLGETFHHRKPICIEAGIACRYSSNPA
jgi:hypothetical protein